MAGKALGLGFLILIFGFGWTSGFIFLGVGFGSEVTVTFEDGSAINPMMIGLLFIVFGIIITVYEQFIRKKNLL